MKFHQAVHDSLADQAAGWRAANPEIGASFDEAAKVLKAHEQENGDDDADDEEEAEEKADNS